MYIFPSIIKKLHLKTFQDKFSSFKFSKTDFFFKFQSQRFFYLDFSEAMENIKYSIKFLMIVFSYIV